MNCFEGPNAMSGDCFQTILHAVAEGLVVFDSSGRVRFCNQSAGKMIGCPEEDLMGREIEDLGLSLTDGSAVPNPVRENEINGVECTLLTRTGSTIPAIANTRKITRQDGSIVGAVLTCTDISTLKRTQTRLEQIKQSGAKRKTFHGMVGHGRRMAELFELVELAAASNATILITGESGTGKELVAQAIHDEGARSNAPLVKVNCSALPENLLESELFGHARGSFTGAIRDKVGKFEFADGGTLFLDEIGEISPLIQVKLLRFLQDREFERVGDNLTRRTDVRIVAATNKDLRELVAEGRFREDLFYRLKVFPIHLPPLRDRKEDIGPLVEHFVRRFNKETGKNLQELTHDAALTMMDYCWPGNIRELENAIEHAFVTCQEGKIDLFDLPLEIRRVELRNGICLTEEMKSATGPFKSSVSPTRAKTSTRHEITKEEVIQTLQMHGGNRAAAAQALGVDRTTLWRWMKKFGIVAHPQP